MNTAGPDCYRTTARSLDRWRRVAGQAGIEAWCRLHNLDPNRTCVELEIHGGLVVGSTWVEVDGRRTGESAQFTRTLIAPPPPCALELAA